MQLHVPQKGGNLNWPWMAGEAVICFWLSVGNQDKCLSHMSVAKSDLRARKAVLRMKSM